MARFDKGPYFGRDPDEASRRPESLSDFPGRRAAPDFGAGPEGSAAGLAYPAHGSGVFPPDPGFPTPGPGPSAPRPGFGPSGSGSGPSASGSGFGPAASEFGSGPSDSGRGYSAPAPPPVLNEPTQSLPTVKPLKAGARAVIVYQEPARRPWRLWAFTAVLVALTAGVVLGQTVAFEPTYRSGANAQAAVLPAASSPSAAAASGPPVSPAWPDAAHRVTAPLGATKSQVLQVVGTSAILLVRSADLGKSLYNIATIDRSAVPRLTVTKQGATLELIPTGDSGTVGAEIQLNSKVAWTLDLAGGLNQQSIDLRAGGAAGIQLTGGSAHTALLLPAPTGTVPLAVKGPLGDLTVSTRTSTPLRIKLTDGADSAVIDGKPHHNVKPGTTLTSTGWTKAKNRYDLTTTGKVAALLATTAPPVG